MLKLQLLFIAALKIHITAEMNDELANIGGFKTEHRGLIDVKVSTETLYESIHSDKCRFSLRSVHWD